MYRRELLINFDHPRFLCTCIYAYNFVFCTHRNAAAVLGNQIQSLVLSNRVVNKSELFVSTLGMRFSCGFSLKFSVLVKMLCNVVTETFVKYYFLQAFPPQIRSLKHSTAHRVFASAILQVCMGVLCYYCIKLKTLYCHINGAPP